MIRLETNKSICYWNNEDIINVHNVSLWAEYYAFSYYDLEDKTRCIKEAHTMQFAFTPSPAIAMINLAGMIEDYGDSDD